MTAMKIALRSFLLISTLVAVTGLTNAVVLAQIPAAITNDPIPDKEFPAKMEAPDILSHGSRLNAVFYLASDGAPHPTVLLLHGFPGNEKNLDLAYTLRRAGWNVLLPHYRGSWGSGGNFSFANALEDAQAALDFLRSPGNAAKFHVDPARIIVIGHSMGGWIAAYTATRNADVAGLVMMAAWNLGGVVSRPDLPERLDTFQNGSPRLAGTTPEALVAEAKAHAAEWNYVGYAPQLKTRPVFVLETNDRNIQDNQSMARALRETGNTRVTETALETDHTFSDHRIAMQAAILAWLASLPVPSAR
jgi:pimeloyl-ACP methyl ester carboxylesterase